MNITVIVVELLIMFLVFTFLVIGLLLINPVTFIQGLLLTYTYAIALFIWDTFFLDWVLFANVKRIRLPGTGHMVKNIIKWFHVKVCIPMIPVFAIVDVLSTLIMAWIW